MTTDRRTIAIWAEAPRAGDGEPIMGDTTAPSGLPWNPIPEDLRHFRETTRNHVLIMGRTTFDKLPAELKRPRATAERPLIVLTHDPAAFSRRPDVYIQDPNIRALNPTGVLEHQSLLAYLEDRYPDKSIAVIGGGKVIEAFKPFITDFYVTSVRTVAHGDALAPRDAFFDDFRLAKTHVLAVGRATMTHHTRKASQ